MGYHHTAGHRRYRFDDLRTLLAAASPARSGDALAGIAAASEAERMAARFALAEVPLSRFLDEALVPYEADEITRLIVDTHDAAAFAEIAHLTVGDFREWLLRHETDGETLARVAPGITPEMAAAVSKLMRNQELILVAARRRVVTRFRNTLGLPGRMAVRLQPNHPTDDPRGVAAAILDGLLYGCGDAVVGINQAGDSLVAITDLLRLTDTLRERFEIPTQTCVLTHVTHTLRAIEAGAGHLQGTLGELTEMAALAEGRLKLEPGRVALASLLAESIHRARQRRPGLVVDLTSEPGIPPAFADRRRLVDALTSLFAFAGQRLEGEAMTIRASYEAAHELGIRIDINTPKRPMSEVEAGIARRPFHRLSGQPGLGLDLARADGIIRLSNGRLDLQAFGEGMRFTIFLPAAAPRRVDPATADRYASPA
ncbi:MAG: ethanolamine ammonia-lyase subunit EutB [Myxococcales bacterium]|nr:ethanolamine ammonia-lyase subunit EutB [Myxococcales bacterium]